MITMGKQVKLHLKMWQGLRKEQFDVRDRGTNVMQALFLYLNATCQRIHINLGTSVKSNGFVVLMADKLEILLHLKSQPYSSVVAPLSIASTCARV